MIMIFLIVVVPHLFIFLADTAPVVFCFVVSRSNLCYIALDGYELEPARLVLFWENIMH